MDLHSAQPFPDILEEHWDDLDFLWSQRGVIVFDGDYDLLELAEHEERIEAHLDGLRIAGARGLSVAREVLASGAAPQAAIATRLLMESGDEDRALVLDAFTAGGEAGDGVRDGLRHIRATDLQPVLPELEALASGAPSDWVIAAVLDVLAFHGRDFKPMLQLLVHEDAGVRALAWGAHGRTARFGETELAAALGEVEEGVRRSALFALADAGTYGLAVQCADAAFRETDPDGVALEMLGVLGQLEYEADLVRSLATAPVSRYAIRALGALGAPSALPEVVRAGGAAENEVHALAAWQRVTGAELPRELDVETWVRLTEEWCATDRGSARWQEGRAWPEAQWHAGPTAPSLSTRRDLYAAARVSGRAERFELEALAALQVQRLVTV